MITAPLAWAGILDSAWSTGKPFSIKHPLLLQQRCFLVDTSLKKFGQWKPQSKNRILNFYMLNFYLQKNPHSAGECQSPQWQAPLWNEPIAAFIGISQFFHESQFCWEGHFFFFWCKERVAHSTAALWAVHNLLFHPSWCNPEDVEVMCTSFHSSFFWCQFRVGER